MIIIDAFAGTGSATAAFAARDHWVLHLETHPAKMGTPEPIVARDVWDVAANPALLPELYRRPDFIWLSPPCQKFAMGGDRHSWEHGADSEFFGPRFPLTRAAWDAVGNVVAAKQLIRALKPRIGWIMENPRAGLRTLRFMDNFPEPFTVTYCGYGDSRMKATDLWSNLPLADHLKPACKNRSPCHEAAPRGAKTGTQGLKDPKERGRVPFALSEAICTMVESLT